MRNSKGLRSPSQLCNGLQVLYKVPHDGSVQVGYINSFSSENEYKWSAIYPQKVAPEEHISGHCCCLIIIVIVDIAQIICPGTKSIGKEQTGLDESKVLEVFGLSILPHAEHLPVQLRKCYENRTAEQNLDQRDLKLLCKNARE